MSLLSEFSIKLSTRQQIGTSLIAGSLAGAIAKTAIAPLDRAKINFQVGHAPFTYRGLYEFLRSNVKTLGLRSLWRGNSANMVRVIPSAAINFTSHEQYKKLLQVDADHNPTPFRRLLAGSLAGMTAVAFTYPADLTRARMAVTSKLEYGNLIQIFVNTYRHEGARGLYKGFLPTLTGSIPYAGVGYFTYETLKIFHKSVNNDDPNPFLRVVYGALAGAAGQTSSYPLDVVRRRMQTAGIIHKDEYTLRVRDLFAKILKEEGFRKGLYKGLSMNWIKGPIAAGIGFMTYDLLQVFVRKYYIQLFVNENV